MNKKVISLTDFVVSELALNPKVSHGHFRRLIQLALLPKNGERPSNIPKKLGELSGESASTFTQALSDLERLGLVVRVGGLNGAYEINTNKAEWFPAEMSQAEKEIRKELDLLEQLKTETIEKLNAIKMKGQR